MFPQLVVILALIYPTICKLNLYKYNDTLSIILREKILQAVRAKLGHANDVLLCGHYNTEMNLPSMPSLRGMIGLGFDRLTGVATAPVLGETFRFCQTSPDRKYFIPDNYTAEPIFDRKLDITSSEYHSYKDFSMNAKSDVSMGASGTLPEPLPPVTIGFSMDVSVSMSKGGMEKSDESLLEMKVRNNMYRMKGNTAAGLSDSFRNRLSVIVDHIKRRHYQKAQYYIELLLLDYGTEVVSEVIVGTKVYLRAYMKSSMLETSKSHAFEIKTTTSVGFKGVTVDVGTSNGRNSTKRDMTSSMSKTVQIMVQGGAKLEFLKEANQSNFLRTDTPIAISRNWVPLFVLMNNKMLEQFYMSNSEVQELRHRVERTTGEYFERNRINGCTDKDAANFDFQANYDDRTCIMGYCGLIEPVLRCEPNITEPIMNEEFNVPSNPAYYETLSFEDYTRCVQDRHFVRKNDKIYDKTCGSIPPNFKTRITLGGMFQTCKVSETSEALKKDLALLNLTGADLCKRFETKNIVTNDYSCSSYSKPKVIIRFRYSVPDETFEVSHRNCDPDDESNCYHLKIVITIKHQVEVTSYWCQKSDQKDDEHRIYFSGSFDQNQPNNFVGRSGCPKGIRSISFFEHTVFCVATQPFPLTGIENTAELTRLFNESEAKNFCEHKQSKHLITVVVGVKIYGCIFKKNAYRNLDLPMKIKGPFVDRRRVFEKANSRLEVYIDNALNHTIPLADVGHRIHDYFKDQIESLESSFIKVVTTPIPNASGVEGLFTTNAIFIILGALLFILAVVAFVYVCKQGWHSRIAHKKVI